VKEIQPVTEHPRFVVALDPQALLQMTPSDAAFEPLVGSFLYRRTTHTWSEFKLFPQRQTSPLLSRRAGRTGNSSAQRIGI
jgi:hypothetical protein